MSGVLPAPPSATPFAQAQGTTPVARSVVAPAGQNLAQSPASARPPALLVAGERSGCGKTTLSLALMAAFVQRGLITQGFKTGPDFLDPAWHAAITGRPSFNIDLWMHDRAMSASTPKHATALGQFARAAVDADITVIEGAMGFFDGLPGLPASCADVAALMRVPALLAVDCRGSAATTAAIAHGLINLRPGLPILGVVGTFTGSQRHAALISRAFADAGLPLLGFLPRHNSLALPSRHLGLTAPAEALNPDLINTLAHMAEQNLNLDLLLTLAKQSAAENPFSCPLFPPLPAPSVRVALARDEAFAFWYPEHNTLLAQAGIELVPFSPLRDSGLPPRVQGVILPGGYPELHAKALSNNLSMKEALRAFSGPIYGECGGYLYMMDSLECEGKSLPLCGLFPLKARLEQRRCALGYREVQALAGPWQGLTLRGHEFHYSRITQRPDSLPPLWTCLSPADPQAPSFAEGAALGKAFGSYIHLALLSHPLAAFRFADACRQAAQSQPIILQGSVRAASPAASPSTSKPHAQNAMPQNQSDIHAATPAPSADAARLGPEEIESRSFALIDAELPEPRPFSSAAWEVARRMVHTSGDTALPTDLLLPDDAVRAGVEALLAGAPIFTDTRMALSGMTVRHLAPLRVRASCLLDLPGCAQKAKAEGITRSRAAMLLAAPHLPGSIVAIGNAPTALLTLLDMLDQGMLPPALIIGMPVGFINAAESKALLRQKGWPALVLQGRKGGSPLAAAAVNALAVMALREKRTGI